MSDEQERNNQARTIGQVVAYLQPRFPDVSHSSLRFLEREGFIRSVRTPGGHRLYPPDEVERIERIKRWQGERLSLVQIRERLGDLDHLSEPAALADEFVRNAVAGNLVAAGALIERADGVGLSLSRIFGDVLTPALIEVGERWAAGDVPVAREKEVSELARELIVELTRRHEVPEPKGPVIVAACVEGERHELGLRMIAGLLRQRGYRVYFLGADVAPTFLFDAVTLRSPTVVLISARQPDARPYLEAALSGLHAMNGSYDVIVGGNLAWSERQMIEGYGAIPALEGGPVEAVVSIEAIASDGTRASDSGMDETNARMGC